MIKTIPTTGNITGLQFIGLPVLGRQQDVEERLGRLSGANISFTSMLAAQAGFLGFITISTGSTLVLVSISSLFTVSLVFALPILFLVSVTFSIIIFSL
jgi:hypothetical protein